MPGIEDIFLTYANLQLKGKPEKLADLFDEAVKYFYFEPDMKSHVDRIIEYMPMLCNYRDRDLVLDEAYDEKVGGDWHERVQAWNALYECATRCEACYPGFESKAQLKRLWKEAGLGNKRPKCFECGQAVFVHILSEIMQGMEYSAVGGGVLALLFWRCFDDFRQYVAIKRTESEESFTETLREDREWIRGYYIGWPYEVDLLNLIWKLVGVSLAEYLLKGDRRKIGRCEKCKRFYVSKTLREQRFCDDPCRLAYHNKERIESGKAKEYKRKKRREGAKPSYYGQTKKRG